MKVWKPILLILPAGLMVGIIGAQLADPRSTIASERTSSYLSESERRVDARNRASPFYSPERDAEESSRSGGYRPDLDWDEEVWPGSGSEAYAYYDDRNRSADDDWIADGSEYRWFEDTAPAPFGGLQNRSAAEEAGLAAERAAEEALEAAQSSPPSAGAASTQPRAPAPPVEREPRTADGDLPAIW